MENQYDSTSHSLSFDAIRDEERRVSVKVFFVDLADYRRSIELLYKRVYEMD